MNVNKSMNIIVVVFNQAISPQMTIHLLTSIFVLYCSSLACIWYPHLIGSMVFTVFIFYIHLWEISQHVPLVLELATNSFSVIEIRTFPHLHAISEYRYDVHEAKVC